MSFLTFVNIKLDIEAVRIGDHNVVEAKGKWITLFSVLMNETGFSCLNVILVEYVCVGMLIDKT